VQRKQTTVYLSSLFLDFDFAIEKDELKGRGENELSPEGIGY
jgi:hypothetical protein